MKMRGRTALLTALGLAAVVPPAAAQTFVTYHCQDGTEFNAVFFEDDRRAHVQLDGKAIALARRPGISGTRYVKDDVTLRITKTAATLKRGKLSTQCSAD
jgi:membrane-bound inhibitor of C-type lysozyme